MPTNCLSPTRITTPTLLTARLVGPIEEGQRAVVLTLFQPLAPLQTTPTCSTDQLAICPACRGRPGKEVITQRSLDTSANMFFLLSP
ncbi:unnamed protein product [Protopolystoma xenopodis]|uniref:Uncharacterized protein n=1 Tax=Protopolystoma xenopodis TaxID=117903 RepID=A0A3S5A8Q7_9PLAT|nr:unnamed protein product [Protopolystoma xenopodis]